MSRLNGRIKRLEQKTRATGTTLKTEWIDVQGQRWQIIHGSGCRILLPDNGRDDTAVFDPIHNSQQPIATITAKEWEAI